jgi:hypothetical protein
MAVRAHHGAAAPPLSVVYGGGVRPALLLLLLVVAVISVPGEFIYRLRQQRAEKELRHRLAAAGRYPAWDEVEAKLKAGEGTLLVEHRAPKGPIREWWTEDDWVAAAPVPLPTSLKSLSAKGWPQALQDFAKAGSARSVAIETGSAQLTEVPVPLDRRVDPRKYVVVDLGGGLMTAIVLVTGRKLAEKSPQGTVITLRAWSAEPLRFIGDAESVFLAPSEAGARPSPGGS